MDAASLESAGRVPSRSDRFHLRRGRKDTLARWFIRVGGVFVLFAVVLIFFYLLLVVAPLFKPASASLQYLGYRADWANSEPLYLALEEQAQVGLRITAGGGYEFFTIDGLETVSAADLLPSEPGTLSRVAAADEHTGLLSLALGDSVWLVRHSYESNFDSGVQQKKIIPRLDYPYGAEPVMRLDPGEITGLALSESADGLLLAAVQDSRRVTVFSALHAENLLTGEPSLETNTYSRILDFYPTAIAVSGNHRWLYLGDGSGRVHRFSLPGLESAGTSDLQGAGISVLTMLLGGVSLLAGDNAGVITQLFPVRNELNEYSLAQVRQFRGGTAGIRDILVEQRRKGFLSIDLDDQLAIYYSTSGRQVYSQSVASLQPRALGLSPRSNGLLIEGLNGSLSLLGIDNPHPEISFSSLWKKVWYENYAEPAYVWQSSAASNGFEPKFSLTPLVFGTVKAAFYAMLFAIPLALMSAIYTAYFMAPQLRRLVKPGIEIMAAMPTVILGFLAGLWFAPFLEEHLAGIFAILLILPPGVLCFCWYWQRYAGRAKTLLPEGFEPLLQLPVMIILGALALWLADPLQYLIFGTDLRSWLGKATGLAYDQRNALVVGCAMGIAVIPTIFSIAEDAIYGVPRSLSDGSLALGATPWQSLVRVVIPTASPGIFSALMIGLGRAVGETMIVLMATGNTPIMDWNLFEGMRTLAANIAVELPESEVQGTHYRILFLAALVLFLFTFIVNSGAELVRQRLRDRYSSL